MCLDFSEYNKDMGWHLIKKKKDENELNGLV